MYEAMDWAFDQDLPQHQYWVLVTLCKHMNSITRRCDPGVTTIAKGARIGESSAKLALRALTATGFITPTHRKEGVRNLSNSYVIHWDEGLYLRRATTQGGLHDDPPWVVIGPRVGRSTTTNKKVELGNKPGIEPKTNATRSREKLTDPRFQEFVALLQGYWQAENPLLPFEFTSKDGKALKTLLSARMTLTGDVFRSCLANRRGSDDVNHAKEFCFWLPRLMEYAAHPLNKYGQPKGFSDGKNNGKGDRQSAAERNQSLSKQSIASAVADLFGESFGSADGADGSVLSAPGDPARDLEGLAGEMGGANHGLRLGHFRGVTLEGGSR